MPDSHRIRLSEDDAMERGVRCPNCGSYTSFGDIVTTGRCRGSWRGDCTTELRLDLIIKRGHERADAED